MSQPPEPRWGDPQAPGHDPRSPGYDPRSPEWRNPEAKPWWSGRQQPPGFPQSPMYPGPPPGPRRTRLAVVLGVAAALVIVLGVSLALTRGTSKPARLGAVPAATEDPFPNGGPIASPAPTAPTDAVPTDPAGADDPVAATKAYYADLAADRPKAAFALLCEQRQQAQPLADYSSAYAQDVATGTGIVSFTQSGQVQREADAAAVPGTLVLADHESVPITVLLITEDGGWRVCSSDLGGVLPNPGSGGAGPSAGTVTT